DAEEGMDGDGSFAGVDGGSGAAGFNLHLFAETHAPAGGDREGFEAGGGAGAEQLRVRHVGDDDAGGSVEAGAALVAGVELLRRRIGGGQAVRSHVGAEHGVRAVVHGV